jgi:hypothetical protein
MVPLHERLKRDALMPDETQSTPSVTRYPNQLSELVGSWNTSFGRMFDLCHVFRQRRNCTNQQWRNSCVVTASMTGSISSSAGLE